MILKPKDNIEKGVLTQENNPISQAQEPFKERAFCIVGDEMKIKMRALGLDEDDLVNMISSENNIDGYLKLIDKFFNHLLELKDIIYEDVKNKLYECCGENKNDDYADIILIDTKTELCNLIFHYEELSTLFSHFPNEGINIIISCIEKGLILDLIIALRKGIEKYNFSWDLLIEFFEKVPREVHTSISDQGDDGIRSINLLIETYLVLSDSIKQKTLFDDLIKISLSTGKKNVGRMLTRFETIDDEYKKYISDNYKCTVKLLILAGINSNKLLNSQYVISKSIGFIEKNDEIDIIGGIEKLGPDFIYIFDSNFKTLEKILKKFPGRFIEFCENLKKLADYSGNNEDFYKKSLDFITQFLVNNPDKWDYLYKSAQILGKYSLNVMGTGIKFLEVLYTKFPEKYEEILQKTLDLGKNLKDKNDVLFFSSGLDFLSEYLEKDGDERFFEMAEKMVKLSNKYLTEESNGAFYSQKEEPLSYGLGFIKEYLKYFPEKYDEILEKVLAFISVECNSKINKWENYFLGMSDFIHSEIISTNPKILDNILVFFDEFYFDVENINLVFDLVKTDFNEKNKNTISNVLVWLLQNNPDGIISFIKLLFVINDLSLKIDLDLIFDGNINNEKLKKLKKEVGKKLKRKIFFQNNKDNATYDETIQEVFGERIDKKLKGFEKIPEIERKANIKRINEKQKNDLKPYGIECFDDYDEDHRTLVLYFRAENMDTFQFSLITHILHKYISSGYSKVFDRILITSRGDGQYPHEIHELGNIPYQYHDFTMITNIFANTIHFTHGTVIEDNYMNTTTHIVGIANLAHTDGKGRITENGNYIPLYLKYGKTEGNYKQEHFEMDRSGNFEDLFDEIIKAVKACEEKMIENSKN